jgi:hypothetical protein
MQGGTNVRGTVQIRYLFAPNLYNYYEMEFSCTLLMFMMFLSTYLTFFELVKHPSPSSEKTDNNCPKIVHKYFFSVPVPSSS